ncbi:MAG: hypothetical protein K8S98_02120 [Planctomycetes bacterium]|nr:hypothetical protein [Planctomycetota bacterium]
MPVLDSPCSLSFCPRPPRRFNSSAKARADRKAMAIVARRASRATASGWCSRATLRRSCRATRTASETSSCATSTAARRR